jgi:hypothetical protein
MTEVAESTVQFEIIDHNVIPDQYIVYIVDLWDGNKNDPAVGVNRYIGVWKWDVLEDEQGDALDPSFASADLGRYSMSRSIKPEPLHWDHLEVMKAADRESERFKQDSDHASNAEYHRYSPSSKRSAELYNEFLIGIDMLAKDENNEQAWEMVEKYRTYQAQKNEK